MRRSVFVLCALGFIFLIVGSVLAVPSVRGMFFRVVHCTGRIGYPDDTPEQVSNGQSNGTSLDLLGYAVVLASFGFFAVAFAWNRRPV